MATILVTGVAGFIGYWTAEALLARGDTVIGIDNLNTYYDVSLKRARRGRLRGRCRIYGGDLADLPFLRRVLKKHRIDKICHLAAQAGVRYSLKNPFVYERSNVLGTLNLLELCHERKIKKFVYASSSSVYGGNKKIPFSVRDRVDKPISLYAATKRANELMAYTYHHLYGLSCVGLRFFTVYGPWGRPDMALFKFTRAILAGKPIDLYNRGRMKRDFTHISDIVDGIMAALDKKFGYRIFNLGNSRPVRLLDFVRSLEAALGKKAIVRKRPIQPGDVPATCADIRDSQRFLGFRPRVSINEGIRDFVNWYRDYYKK